MSPVSIQFSEPTSSVAPSLWRNLKAGPLKVFVVGGGNWGTSISRICARNTKQSYLFNDTVHMWLFDEKFEGRMLTEIINETHENKKYLPDVKLPENLVAIPNLEPLCKEADLLIFVLPHQFLVKTCLSMKGKVKPTAKAISLIKGIHVEGGQPFLFSTFISNTLGIPCCVLSGANVAKDIALDQFSESTIGYHESDKETAAVWQQLFDCPSFKINGVPDVCGVEMCGAVKNVVALAAGFCDGLKYGTNTKAAVIRIGVEEMKLFANLFCDGVLEETFFDSAGYADVITTCFGGRNVRCAAEFIKRGGKEPWEKIEEDMLGGQKMQGQLTCKEIYDVLEHHKLQDLFPLFTATYNVAFKGAAPESLLEVFEDEEPRHMRLKGECSLCVLSDAVKQRKDMITASRQNPSQASL